MLIRQFRRVATTPPRRRLTSKNVTINLNSKQAIGSVHSQYLSFSIDISVLAGGFWWEGGTGSKRGLGTERVPPLDLDQPQLDKLVSALGPAFVRVGGSEADKVAYFTSVSKQDTKADALNLSQEMWHGLHDFCQRNALDLMFTFKYGLFSRLRHGRWQDDQVRALLEYSQQHQQNIAVCELGNELNAYWAFHGLTAQPSAYKLAQDYGTFIKTIRQYSPNSLIAGPGSAFWPKIGETIRPISNLTAPFLSHLPAPIDIVSWHYYPFQSSRSPVKTRAATLRNLLNPKCFLDYQKYCGELSVQRNKYWPKAQLWTGETGSAQCGGQKKLSDRFVSSFWWADQLGRGAKLGQQVMVRQSLIGGDYALINRRNLKPNPDYWVSWLWNKLMGQDVYDVSSSDPQVLVYCHKAKKLDKCTLLIINMSASPKIIQAQHFGAKKRRYELTADSLTSKKVRINGIRPKFKNAKVKLKDFPKLSKLNIVSPYSINFWCFEM